MFYFLSKNLLFLKKVPLELPLLDEACRDMPPSAVVPPVFSGLNAVKAAKN